jgi:hypothetical protein
MIVHYDYGGQWFDDMGSLAMAFSDSPAFGIDLARSGMQRDDTNSAATSLLNMGISGYHPEEPTLGA